jgi:DNA polymerase-1
MTKLIFCDFETNEGAVDRQLTDVWCLGYKLQGTPPQVATDNIKDVLQSFIDDGYVPVFHNAAFDLWVAESIGVQNIKAFHDTMLIHYLVAPTESHSLASLGEVLGYPKLTSSSFNDGYTEQMGTYCKRDVEITEAAFNEYYKLLSSIKPLQSLYFSVELPFIRCIIDMEVRGVHVDKERWFDVLKGLEAEQLELLDDPLLKSVPPQLGRKSKTKRMRPDEQVSTDPEIGKWCLVEHGEEYKWAMWEPFNPASSQQVGNVLGLDKSDSDTLEECGNPLASIILKYRKVTKMLSTYGESLLKQTHADDRLHGSYNQTVTRTGRLSSSKPNLQNIPSRGDIGGVIRSLFIAPPGRKLVSIDLDQFQLRIYAWYLHNMVDTGEFPDADALWLDFNNNPNADPHQAKADVLGIPRGVAKTLNFAVLFGASPAKAAVTAGTTVEEMKGFFETQDSLFPSGKVLRDTIIKAVRSNRGVLFDLYGRRGWYPEVNESDWGLKGRAERQAFNFIIQATEATIVKMIIIEARQRLLGKADLIMTVHDEITFECDLDKAESVRVILDDVVNNTPWLPGLKVTGTATVGDNWHDVH